MPINIALKVAIVRRGLRQLEVGRRARINEVRMSHIVHGRRRVTANEQQRLSKVLGVSVEELFPDSPRATLPPSSDTVTV